MELSCALSDTLYEKCTIALEPYYSKEFFPYSIAINKPNFVPASVGFWTYLCNLLNFDDSFKNMDLSYLMIPTITGEGASAGEEKYFNQTSKKHKFGSSKLPYPLAPVTFSIGGGTTESSGIFVTLFKGLQEKLLHNAIKKETLGLTPHRFVECEVLNDKGEYCKLNEPGLIVVSADSPCNMMEYYNDPEDTKKCYVVDATGKKWFSLGTYGYKSDKKGRIKMKGRLNDLIYMSDGNVVPYYVIEDSILKDTKNVMSCSLVKTENDYGEELYSCHVKFQPFTTTPKDKIINSIILRLQNDIPVEVLDKLIIVNDDEPFELAPSGKRFTKGLETRPISDKDIFVKNYLYQLPAKNKVYKKS
jgi:acyl-coenzyme A synthetase/AMP-(fatty) acid ligase